MTVNRTAVAAAIVLVVVGLFGIAVFAGINNETSGNGGSPGIINDDRDVKLEETPTIGEGLTQMEPPELVKAPSPEAAKEFGEQDARVGTSWAQGFAQQTAYYSPIWSKLTEPGAKTTDLTPEDYSFLGMFMTEKGKVRLISETGIQEVLQSEEKGPGALALVPTVNEQTVWAPFPIRPNGDSFTIISTGVGPKSAYNGKPTLRVEFNDYHMFDWTYNGQSVSQEIGRHNVYYLAQTNIPNQPWLLDDWESTLLPPKDIPPLPSE